MEYAAAPHNPNTGGKNQQWLNVVQITSGATFTQQIGLSLGELTLRIEDAADHPADSARLSSELLRSGDRSDPAALALYTNTATF